MSRPPDTATPARGLDERDLDQDPIRQFDRWLADAVSARVPEPTAMTLATSTPDGSPSARTVLLKHVDGRGFVFYTNYESRKARELAANPSAALVFLWKPLERQVAITGRTERIPREEAEAYFATRPRESKIGAWASRQSTVIATREVLDARVRELEQQYRDSDPPMPPFWGGFRLVPDAIEFWQGRIGRLHDRLRYARAESGWMIERLSP